MTSLQPLVALLAQTERQRDLALADHLKAQSVRDAAQTQADQLLAYRREYVQRWRAQFCQQGRIELVRCYQGFMERLTQAVEQQARIAASLGEQAAQAGATLREREQQFAAVRKLIERRLAEGRAADLRDEQKQSDELAARIAWSSRSGTGRPNLA